MGLIDSHISTPDLSFGYRQRAVKFMNQSIKSKKCGLCEHFRPYVDLKTKRIHKTEEGQCGWVLRFNWPMAYLRNGIGSSLGGPYEVSSAGPVGVWHDTDATTCKCFEKLKTK